MLSIIKKWGIDTFFKTEEGAVFPLIGIAMAVIVGSAALAVDYTRTQMVRDKVQMALDAAAIAGAHEPNIMAMQATGQRYFNANFPPGYMGAGAIGVRVQALGPDAGHRFFINGTVRVESIFADAIGWGDISIANVEAHVNSAPMAPLDMVFSVDSSGSMHYRDGVGAACMNMTQANANPALCRCGNMGGGACTPSGQSRLANARGAIGALWSELRRPGNRFAFVPWDHRVRSGAFGFFGFGDQYIAGDAGNPNAYYNCPGAFPCTGDISPMLYLTDNNLAFFFSLLGWQAFGNTDLGNGMLYGIRMFENHHFGGWRNWRAPAPTRAIVFITDGAATMDYGQPGGIVGNLDGTAYERFRFWCDWAKDLGIEVYTVGYNMPPTSDTSDPLFWAALNLVYCAGTERGVPSADHVFNATNGANLTGIMRQIAQRYRTYRLTR